MKQVSVLWQRMTTEEKKNFQEQSKKDRERYENERTEFVIKKQDEEQPELLKHSVLDTVKNRLMII